VGRKISRWAGTYGLTVGAAALALVLWQSIVMVFDLPHYILPSPIAVLEAGIRKAPAIAPHYLATWYSAIVGYTIAVVIGVAMALAVAYIPLMRRTLYPGLVFLDELPKVAIAPLLITWFGFGFEAPVILVTLICLFPIFIQSVHGFGALDSEILYLARSTGAREWEMFWKIRLPSALPHIFVGLKYGGSAAMIGAVVAEFLAADRGLGLYLLAALRRVEMALGFATIVCMASIGMTLFFSMQLLETRVIPWHVSQRSERQVEVQG